MINIDSTQETIETTTDDLRVVEHLEKGYTEVFSTKRAESIRILKVDQRFGFYKVLYESGKPVPGLEGDYTSHFQALKEVKLYLSRLKPTTAAKAKQRFGDKPVPELKTKQRQRKRKEVTDADSQPTNNEPSERAVN